MSRFKVFDNLRGKSITSNLQFISLLLFEWLNFCHMFISHLYLSFCELSHVLNFEAKGSAKENEI